MPTRSVLNPIIVNEIRIQIQETMDFRNLHDLFFLKRFKQTVYYHICFYRLKQLSCISHIRGKNNENTIFFMVESSQESRTLQRSRTPKSSPGTRNFVMDKARGKS